jgi:hypothetical protein
MSMAEAITKYGYRVAFKVDGDQCEIIGHILDDGGVYWRFVRDGREYPLRLSKVGMDAMIDVWHHLMWIGPPPESEE